MSARYEKDDQHQAFLEKLPYVIITFAFDSYHAPSLNCGVLARRYTFASIFVAGNDR